MDVYLIRQTYLQLRVVWSVEVARFTRFSTRPHQGHIAFTRAAVLGTIRNLLVGVCKISLPSVH